MNAPVNSMNVSTYCLRMRTPNTIATTSITTPAQNNSCSSFLVIRFFGWKISVPSKSRSSYFIM